MYRVLIVEDDPVIAQAVKKQLLAWGLAAEIAPDFQDVLSTFRAYDPQLVLLDIGLPFLSGYYWCQEIRKFSSVPVMFLSSSADNLNIVMAMNMGADDFIAKPFDLSVLLAKVQALLRRAYHYAENRNILEHRGALLNLSDATLTYQDAHIDLTRNEYRILQLLMEKRGCAVSREEIMQRLWEGDSYIDENTLTVNIGRLRKKLDAAGLTDFIRTKKGIGYLIE